VGGVLLVVFDVLDAILFTGEHGSEVMATSSWFLVGILGLVALVLIALGLVGLYACQAEQAGTLGLIAFVMAFSGTVMIFGLLWGEPFLGPMLVEEAPEVLEIEPAGTLAAGVMLTLVLFALGWLLFGLASLRASVLPRGAAALLMVGAVLFFILALLELPLWTVVLGAAVAWMGYALWSGTAAESELTSEAAM
jgi:hypothetical protein